MKKSWQVPFGLLFRGVSLVLMGVVLLFAVQVDAKSAPPNVVYILCDDLGYGDVQCLNPEQGKIATPHMDGLAARGMVFTDAHTCSSVCTPSRYGVLTGRYNWRTTRQTGVNNGFSPPLISPERLTVAGFLKQQGYATACIGKWHLGMEFPKAEGARGNNPKATGVDWKGTIKNGPTDVGFDYFYGISASLDMPPYIFIENNRFVGEATATKEFHANRRGPAHPDLEAVDVLPTIGRKAVEFIQRQSAQKPFFAYVAFTSPHTPIAPTKEWQGKSKLGAYGDFVMQSDAVIGEIVAAVDAAGFSENTMVVVTSDNGCSKAVKIEELQRQGHFPSAQFRGSKADIWDGGHRVPFIVRWPAGIKGGTSSAQTICLTDLMATCAELVAVKLPETAGEDSVSFAPAFQGKPIVSTRSGVIHHSISGYFAYRSGDWKLCLAKGSGGWTSPKENEVPAGAPVAQLYNMSSDPGEKTNLYESHPEVAARLLKQLETDVQRGRSTAGADLSNDAAVNIWKGKK